MRFALALSLSLSHTHTHTMTPLPPPHSLSQRVVIENEKLLQKAMATGNSAGGSLNVVDFWNLTRNAQTSDGMHTLTAQNVAKASTIVALMEMALKSAA